MPRLVTSYYAQRPDPARAEERVSFGTSGHRGSALHSSFNDAHIRAVVQAVCEERRRMGIDGPLFLGIDTHALSEPARASALEVLAANGVLTFIDADDGYTPTPVVSFAISSHNAAPGTRRADGLIITPSHNPPEDGGIKYNPPHGGPAGTDITSRIEARANALLETGGKEIPSIPLVRALAAETTQRYDFITPYVEALATVLDMDAIAGAGLRLGVDPLGGAAVEYWARISERYGLSLEVVNEVVDPTFSFMTLDHDGRLRMDCSSPQAMAGLVAMKDDFDLAFGNDADSDRHGIVTKAGLMNPNHFLAAAVSYLFSQRKQWSQDAGIGKTLVSSSMIDRVAASLQRRVEEVPVGFKWFVDGLSTGRLGFAGEESAGAAFLRRDGSTWCTDKDGLIMGLLAAELMAVSGRSPHEAYQRLTASFGEPAYERIDVPASAAQKRALKSLDATTTLQLRQLAGDAVSAIITKAPANDEPIGGIKVVSENGWFAARPSGTENVYKIYAESFRGPEHLRKIQEEAQEFVRKLFAGI